MDIPTNSKVSVTKSRYSPTPPISKTRNEPWQNNDKLKKPGFANQFKQSDIIQEQNLQKYDRNLSPLMHYNDYSQSQIHSSEALDSAFIGGSSYNQKQMPESVSNKYLSELKKQAQIKVNNYIKDRPDNKEQSQTKINYIKQNRTQSRHSSQAGSGDIRFAALFPQTNKNTLQKQNQTNDTKYLQAATISSKKYQDNLGSELLKQPQMDIKSKTQQVFNQTNSGQKYAYSQNTSPMSSVKILSQTTYSPYSQQIQQQQKQMQHQQQQLKHYATLVAQSNLMVQNLQQQHIQQGLAQKNLELNNFTQQQIQQSLLPNNISYKQTKQDQHYRYGKMLNNQPAAYDNTPLFPTQQQKSKETFYQKLITDRNFQNFNQKIYDKKAQEGIQNNHHQVSPNRVVHQTSANNSDLGLTQSPQTLKQSNLLQNQNHHNNYVTEQQNRINSYAETVYQRNLSAHNSPSNNQIQFTPKTLQFTTYNNKYQPINPSQTNQGSQKKEIQDAIMNTLLKQNYPTTMPLEQLELRHKKQLDQFKQTQRYGSNNSRSGKLQMSFSEHHTPRNQSKDSDGEGVRSSSMQKKSFDNFKINSQDNLQFSGGKLNEGKDKSNIDDSQFQSNSKTQNKIEQYQLEIELYQKELSNMKYELESLKSQQSTNSELDFLNKQLHNLKSIFLDKKKQLEQEIEQSNTTHKILKEKLTSALSTNQFQKEQLETRQSENSILKNQLELNGRENNELFYERKSSIHNSEIEKENHKLKKELQDLHLKQNKEVEEIQQKYQDYIITIEERSNELKLQLDHLQLNSGNQIQDNGLFINEIETKKQIIQKQNEQIKYLQSHQDDSNNYIKELEEKIVQLEQQILLLNNQLQEQDEKFEEHLTQQYQLSMQKEEENEQQQRKVIEAEMNNIFSQRLKTETEKLKQNEKELYNQINQLKMQNNIQQQELDKSQNIIENSNNSISGLNSQTQNSIHQIQNLNSQIQNLNSQNQTLINQNQQLTIQTQTLNEEKQVLNDQNKYLNDQIKNLNSQILFLNEQLEDQNSQALAQNEEIETLNGQIEDLNDQNQNLNSQIQSLSGQIYNLDNSNQGQSDQNQNYKQEISDLKSQLANALDELEFANANQGNSSQMILDNQALVEKFEQLEKINNDLTNQLVNFEDNESKQRSYIDELQNQIQSQQNQLDEQNKQIEELKQQIEQINQNQPDSLKDSNKYRLIQENSKLELQNLAQYLEDKQNEINTLMNQKEELEYEKAEIEEKLILKMDEFEQFKENIANQSQQSQVIEQLQLEINSLKAQQQELMIQIHDKDDLLEEKDQIIKQQNQNQLIVNSSDTSKGKDEQEEIINTLKKQQEELELQISNKNNLIDEKDQTLKIINSECFESQAEKDQLLYKIEGLEEQVINQKKQLKEIEKEKQEIINMNEDKQQELNKQISDQNLKIDNLKRLISDIQEQLDEKDNQIEELQSHQVQHELNLTRQNSVNNEYIKEIQALSKQIYQQQSQIQLQKTEIEEINSQFTQQSEIDDLKDEKIMELENLVHQLEVQIKGQHQKKENHDKDIRISEQSNESSISPMNYNSKEEREKKTAFNKQSSQGTGDNIQLEMQIEELEQKIAECQQIITQSQQKIQEKEEEISKLQESKIILEQDNQEFQKMTQQFNEEHTKLQQEYQHILAFYKQAVEERDAIQSSQREFEVMTTKTIEDKYSKELRFLQENQQQREYEYTQIIEQKEKIINDLAQKIKEQDSSSENVQIENTQTLLLSRELKEKKDKLKEIEALSIEQQKVIRGLDLEKKEFEKNFKKMTDKIELTKQEYDQQQLLVDKYQKELLSIRSQNELNENQLNNFKQIKQQQEEQLNELQVENNKLKQIENEQSVKIEEIEKELKNLFNSKKFKEEQRQNYTHDDQEFDDLKHKNQDLSNELVEKILDYQLQLDEVQQEKEVLMKKKQDKEKNYDELIEQNKQITEQYDQLKAQIEQQQLNQKEKEENEQQSKGKLSELQIQIEEYEQTINNLHNQRTELTQENLNLSVKVKSLESSITKLKVDHSTQVVKQSQFNNIQPLSRLTSSEHNIQDVNNNQDKVADPEMNNNQNNGQQTLALEFLDFDCDFSEEKSEKSQEKSSSINIKFDSSQEKQDFMNFQEKINTDNVQNSENMDYQIKNDEIKQKDQNDIVIEQDKDEQIKNLNIILNELKAQQTQKDAQLNSKIYHYKEKKKQYRDQLKISEQKLIELQHRIQNESTTLQTRIDAFEEEQKNLQNDYQVQINDLINQKVALYSENHALNEKIKELGEEKERLTLALQEIQGKLRNQQSQNLNDDQNDLNEQLEQKQNEIESLTEDKKLLQEELQQKDQLMYQYIEDNGQLDKQLKILEKQLAQYNTPTTPNEKELGNSSRFRNDTNSSMNEDNFKEDEVNQTIQELKEQIIILHEHAQEKENSLQILQDNINTYLNEKIDYEKQISQITFDYEELQKKLQKFEAQSIQSIDEEQSDNKDLKIQKLKEEFEEIQLQLQNEIMEKNKINSEFQLQIQKLYEGNNLNQDKVQSYSIEQDNNITDQVKILEDQLSQKEGEIKQQKDEIQTLKDECQSTKDQLKEIEEILEESKEQVTYFEDRVNQLMEECTSYGTKMADREEEFNKQMDDNQQYYNKLLKRKNDEYQDLSKEFDDQREQFFELQEKLEKMQQNENNRATQNEINQPIQNVLKQEFSSQSLSKQDSVRQSLSKQSSGRSSLGKLDSGNQSLVKQESKKSQFGEDDFFNYDDQEDNIEKELLIDENKQLIEENKELQLEIKQLQTQIVRIQNEKDEIQIQKDQIQKEKDQIQEEKDEIQNEKDLLWIEKEQMLTEKNETNKAQNEDKEIGSEKEGNQDKELINNLNNQIVTLKNQVETLNQQSESLRQQQEVLKNLLSAQAQQSVEEAYSIEQKVEDKKQLEEIKEQEKQRKISNLLENFENYDMNVVESENSFQLNQQDKRSPNNSRSGGNNVPGLFDDHILKNLKLMSDSPEIIQAQQKKIQNTQDSDPASKNNYKNHNDQIQQLQIELNEKQAKISILEIENQDLQEQVNQLHQQSDQFREEMEKQCKESYLVEYTKKCQDIRKSYRNKIKLVEENKKQEMNELKSQIDRDRSMEMKMIREKLENKIQLLDQAYKMQIQQVREEEECKYNELLRQTKEQYETQIKLNQEGSASIVQNEYQIGEDLFDLMDNNPFNMPDQDENSEQNDGNNIDLGDEDEFI